MPMTRYVLVRLGLMVPTLLAVLALTVAILHAAPGGPASAAIARAAAAAAQHGQVLSEADIAAIRATYRSAWGVGAFARAMLRYGTFHLGHSLVTGQSVAHLIAQRLPVSIGLGVGSTLFVYGLAVPLGIAQAMRAGSRFDRSVTLVMLSGAALPGFLVAILLVVAFGAGGLLPLFPLRGLLSSGLSAAPLAVRALNLAWHLVLPVLAVSAGGLAGLALLVRHATLEALGQTYVMAMRARGASERQIALRYAGRRALLLVVAGLPQSFVAMLFTSALLVEIVFSLPGLGLLGYRAALDRDVPVLLGSLYIYTLTGLLAHLAGDLLARVVDPRIDFSALR